MVWPLKGGRPSWASLVVYHGSDHEFDEFIPSPKGLWFSIYLTTDQDDAEQYTETDSIESFYVVTARPYYTKADYGAGEQKI